MALMNQNILDFFFLQTQGEECLARQQNGFLNGFIPGILKRTVQVWCPPSPPPPPKTSSAAWPVELQIHLFNFRPYLLVKYKYLWKGHRLNIISHFTFIWMIFSFCLTLSWSIKDLKLLTGNELSKCIFGSDLVKAHGTRGEHEKECATTKKSSV